MAVLPLPHLTLTRGRRPAAETSPPGPETVFVLSGGGSHGAAQAGMLLALIEAGVRPDVIVGCSVGALNGAFLASDPSPARARELADVWAGITGRDVFGHHRRATAWNLLTRSDHLVDPAALRALIGRFCPVNDLAEMTVPLHVVTTDLDAGRATWWTRGPAHDILAASACLPALFPPVPLPGPDGQLHRHVDGGVTDTIPVAYAAALGAGTLYVLDVAGETASPAQLSALGVLLRSFTISRYVNVPDPTAAALPGQRVVVLPRPELSGVGIRDFTRCRDLLAAATGTTRAFLASQPSPTPAAAPGAAPAAAMPGEAARAAGWWRRRQPATA